MDLELLAQYGLPGLVVGVVAGLAYALIRRGIRVKIEAEIPPKR